MSVRHEGRLLAAGVVAAAAGRVLGAAPLLPSALTKHTPPTLDEAVGLVGAAALGQIVALGVGRAVLKRAGGPRRVAADVGCVLAGLSLFGLLRFVLGTAPFSPNDHVWTLAVGAALALAVARARPRRGPDLSARAAASVAVGAAIVVASPVLLALAYRAHPGVSEALNRVRAAVSRDSGAWVLGPACDRPFDAPIAFAAAPDGFVLLSRTGRLSSYGPPPACEERGLLLDLSAEIGSTEAELGAFSVALHPAFEEGPHAGEVFVAYTADEPGRQSVRLARFDVSPSDLGARMATQEVLIDQKRGATGLHHGGFLTFDRSGCLLFALGDQAVPRHAQRLHHRFAAGVLRLDVDRRGGAFSAPPRRAPFEGTTAGYFVPRDNPWFGRPDTLEEYWALGLRNPFRGSIDASGDGLWVGDVGEDGWEEHLRVRAGDNGGWPFREGPEAGILDAPPAVVGELVEPFHAYRQTGLARATVGGLRASGEHPDLAGRYLFADNTAGTVSAVDVDGRDPTVLATVDRFGARGISGVWSAFDSVLVTVLGPPGEGRLLRLEPAPAASGPSVAAASPDGAGIWDARCVRCHGVDGRGLPGLLGEMAPRPDLTTWDGDAARARAAILGGGEAVGGSADMPAWRDALSPEEVDAVVAWVLQLGQGGDGSTPGRREGGPGPQ